MHYEICKFAYDNSFYAGKQLLLSACLSHHNSVRPSVCSSACLYVTRVNQSKIAQPKITKSSALAARKTLVSGTIKVFHKFEKCHPERGAKNLRLLANKSFIAITVQDRA